MPGRGDDRASPRGRRRAPTVTRGRRGGGRGSRRRGAANRCAACAPGRGRGSVSASGRSASAMSSSRRYSWSDLPERAALAASSSRVSSGTSRTVIDGMHAVCRRSQQTATSLPIGPGPHCPAWTAPPPTSTPASSPTSTPPCAPPSPTPSRTPGSSSGRGSRRSSWGAATATRSLSCAPGVSTSRGSTRRPTCSTGAGRPRRPVASTSCSTTSRWRTSTPAAATGRSTSPAPPSAFCPTTRGPRGRSNASPPTSNPAARRSSVIFEPTSGAARGALGVAREHVADDGTVLRFTPLRRSVTARAAPR